MVAQVLHRESLEDNLRRVIGSSFPSFFKRLCGISRAGLGAVSSPIGYGQCSRFECWGGGPRQCPKASEDLTGLPDEVWFGTQHCPWLSEASPEHCELYVIF